MFLAYASYWNPKYQVGFFFLFTINVIIKLLFYETRTF